MTFRGGKRLAQEVNDGCPAEKEACLLLTIQDDMDEGPLLTEDEHYIVVTQIRKYRQYKPTKRAVGYFADDSGLNAVAAARRALRRVTDDHELDGVLATSITTARLVRWAANDPERTAVLENALAALQTAFAVDDHEITHSQDMFKVDAILAARGRSGCPADDGWERKRTRGRGVVVQEAGLRA